MFFTSNIKEFVWQTALPESIQLKIPFHVNSNGCADIDELAEHEHRDTERARGSSRAQEWPPLRPGRYAITSLVLDLIGLYYTI